MIKTVFHILIFFILFSCKDKSQWEQKASFKKDSNKVEKVDLDRINQFIEANKDNRLASQSLGTVSNGKLINGKLIPFTGDNFKYFDTLSYLNSRAFVNDKVKLAVLETYKDLKKELPERTFYLMECSNKYGGKLFPHRTHQNGLSIDFMMPLIRDGKPYYGLDPIGASHYWLTFDNSGRYSEVKNIIIDFDLVARHILLLDEECRSNGLKICKVIINRELIDELFASSYGKKLRNSGIYIAQKLTPLINSLHDDHYHIDFEILK